MSTAPFILVDGSSYLYRAFHAMPPLTNSKGKPTGAVYGVVNMIKRLIKDYQPQHIAIVFDAKGKTFRDDLFKEYKANRPAMPDELQQQIEPLLAIIRAMGLPLLQIEGVEADDVIGTLAKQAEKHGLTTLISTGDKDMAQLVDDQITLINTMNNQIYDRQGVINKFGIPPELIIDYLSLVGDSVDNIPGVPKVGPKTAVKWLTEFGNLKNLIENADKISGAVGESLRNHLNALPLNIQLTTIKCDVNLTETPESLIAQPPNNENLIALFRELEFKTWLSELLTPTENTPVLSNKTYETILTKSQFENWLTLLNHAEVLAFDSETTSLNELEAKIVGLSFAIENQAAYLPLGHDYLSAPEQLSLTDCLNALKPILENSQIKKIGHNIKYDQKVLANYDIHLQGAVFDTMLESYVLNASATRHNMDALALKYLGKKTITYEEVAGKGAKQINFSRVDVEKASQYAAEDAEITWELHQHLWPVLQKEEKLAQVFTEIEMPLVNILAKMERDGVLIDQALLNNQSIELEKRLKILEEKTFASADCEFNLNSPKQLQEVLFDKLNLPVRQKTPTGQPSTAEDVLQELALDFPLPKLILEFRSLSKLKSTYTDGLPKQINPDTHRVHTSYNQAVTATGRLSSTDPNLQNIPIKTEEGRKIRQAFIAPKDHLIIASDYSQIELRIMAHLSNDAGLLSAFHNDLDIHRATAAEVFNVSLNDVTDLQRRSAKAINFGLIYGMSAYGLAKQLNVGNDIAKTYIDVYFHRYPGVKAYMEKTRELAHEQGFVETLFGRRLYLAEINSKNIARQRGAERAAINAPMQGTAADIIKRAMIIVDDYLSQHTLNVKMIMQVHDELVFEVHERDVDAFSKTLPQLMQQAGNLNVPLLASVGVGKNWDEAH